MLDPRFTKSTSSSTKVAKSVPDRVRPGQQSAPAKTSLPTKPVLLAGVAAVVIAGAVVAFALTRGGSEVASAAPAVQLAAPTPAAAVAPVVPQPPVTPAMVRVAPAALPGPQLPVAQALDWPLPEEPMPTAAAVEGALDELPALPQAERARLVQQTLAGQTRWVRLTMWDNMDEDGDIVSVHADGVAFTVTLTNARQSFVVPVGAGGIRIVGVDGGGRTSDQFAAERFMQQAGVRSAVNTENPVTVTVQTTQGARTSGAFRVGQSIHIR